MRRREFITLLSGRGVVDAARADSTLLGCGLTLPQLIVRRYVDGPDIPG